MGIKARNVDPDSAVRRMVFTGMVPTDPLATGNGKGRIYIYGLGEELGEIERVSAVVATAPTGQALTCQLHNGTADVLSSVLSMTATETAATSTSIVAAQAEVSDGDVLRIDIDQVGSTEAGEHLTVSVVVKLK